LPFDQVEGSTYMHACIHTFSYIKGWNGAIDKQEKLPFLYWTPKMHKTPTKKRFIASSASCTTKNTSATITLCLKLIQQAHKIYCDRIKAYTGFNFMWITQNSMELQHTLQKKGRNLATYDFSTLYTAIPHTKLKDKLSQLISMAYKGMNKKYIKVNARSATWSKENKGDNIIKCEQLIDMVEWLIDNTLLLLAIPCLNRLLAFQWALIVLHT